MINLDDNEFSKKSKEAAANFNSPILPNWNKLSTKLDQELPINNNKRQLFWWWFAPLLLMLNGLGYYFVNTNFSKTTTSVLISNDSIASNNKQNSKITSQKTKELTFINVKANSIITQIDSWQINNIKTIESNKNPNVSIRIGANIGIKENNNDQFDKDSSTSNLFNTSNTQKSSKTKINFNQLYKNDKVLVGNNNLNNKLLLHEPTNIYPPNTILSKKSKADNNDDSLVIGSISTIEQPLKDGYIKGKALVVNGIGLKKADSTQNKIIVSENKPITINKISSNHLFSIEASGLLDITTINNTYWKQLSVGGGIIGGYYLNSKWSIHSGLIFTRKNYKAAGEDFTPPKTSGLNNYHLESVAGYCQMWETPLNVRYHFATKNRKNFFISTGLSSYFVRKENYDYTYYNQWGKLVTYNAQYENPTNYIFSIANISAGMEYPISKHLNIHIEPYIKFPLSGLGYGNMHLTSYGVNMSLMFKTKK